MAGNGSSENNNNNNELSQERLLPIANVGRIMKKVLPGNAKVSKEAKETMQECVSEFISFITGEASEKCQKEKRKTINGDDLVWAMTTLGFEEYVEPLKGYLHKYREMEGEKTAMPMAINMTMTGGIRQQGDGAAAAAAAGDHHHHHHPSESTERGAWCYYQSSGHQGDHPFANTIQFHPSSS